MKAKGNYSVENGKQRNYTDAMHSRILSGMPISQTSKGEKIPFHSSWGRGGDEYVKSKFIILLCCLRIIAAQRDHFVRRLSPSVRVSVR